MKKSDAENVEKHAISHQFVLPKCKAELLDQEIMTSSGSLH